MNNPRYVLVRVSLLKGALKSRERVFTELLRYGIKDYAAKLPTDGMTAYGTAAYDYFYAKENMPENLYDELSTFLEDASPGELLFGGGGGGFHAETAYEMAVDEGLTQDVLNRVIEYANVKKALHCLNLSGGIVWVINAIAINKNEPLAMVRSDKLLEFRKYEKTQYDIIQFCAYIAIKSFLGQRKAVKTNIKGILERALPNEKKLIAEYSTRRKFETLRNNLEMNWHVKFYSNHTRGFWVSTSLTYEDLALHAEKNKQKNKLATLNFKKSEAKKTAIEYFQNY